jgi:hypothetical protein
VPQEERAAFLIFQLGPRLARVDMASPMRRLQSRLARLAATIAYMDDGPKRLLGMLRRLEKMYLKREQEKPGIGTDR